MDRQSYLRRLRARVEHVEGALERALEVGSEHPVKRPVSSLREHVQKIEKAGDDWEEHREGVEKALIQLQDEIEAHGGALGQAAESVRDGAVELFRGEPSEIVRRAEEIIRKARGDER